MTEISVKAQVMAYLGKSFGIKGDDANDIYKAFVESMQECLGQGQSCLRTNDWSAMARAGHSIKGTAANVGAGDLSELGLELEEVSREENVEKCQQLLERIEEQVKILQ